MRVRIVDQQCTSINVDQSETFVISPQGLTSIKDHASSFLTVQRSSDLTLAVILLRQQVVIVEGHWQGRDVFFDYIVTVANVM